MNTIRSFLLITLLIFPLQSWSMMKLNSTIRKFDMVQKPTKIWVSNTCNRCEAETIYENLTKERAKKALERDDRGQIPIGTRLCSGLGGLVWILMDDQNVQHAVCEFRDKSATLASDLSSLAHQLLD